MDDQRDKNREKETVTKAIAEIATTEAGVIFFQWLMKTCFFQNSTITADPQGHEINPLGTVYNESRRRVYLDIRRVIPKNILKKIEN